MFQYGYGDVQKFACPYEWPTAQSVPLSQPDGRRHPRTFTSDAPMGLSTGTDSEKTPEAMYESHRFTIADRCSRDSAEADAPGAPSGPPAWGKNVGERSEAVADLKSGGVTSETNQGIILGLE